MLKNLDAIPKVAELRKRILFTFFILIIYRIGTHIPLPGINGAALAEFFKTQFTGTIFGLYDIFVGGALQRAAIFGAGIMPYISASIIMQLLTTTWPYLERLHKEGEHGRRLINRYTRYFTVVVAGIQSFGIALFLQNVVAPSGARVVPNPGPTFMFQTIVALVAGTLFLMWLGEQISDNGIGNGISVLIFAGSLDSVPYEFANTIQLLRTGSVSPLAFLFLIIVIILTIAGVVLITEAQRRIPIQYAKRVVGRRVYGGQSTYLPLTLNTAGVIPIIFAQTILMIPSNVLMFLKVEALQNLVSKFSPGNVIYDLVYAVLIIFFAYYYTSIVMSPKDLADNLQRYSGFIPGVRPGQKTAEYIDKVMSRILLPGAIAFAIIAIIPYHIMKWTGAQIYFGGTRILIIVGVALELMQQINSYLIMNQYEGLLKKGKIRGWRG
ncbi:MAG: preprotein translocase subunit SecY [candidate division WOR-3 bacterium]